MMIRAKDFDLSAAALELYREGLQHATADGFYTLAHNSLQLAEACIEAEGSSPIIKGVQLGRVGRDNAFTTTREALFYDGPEAEGRLVQAKDKLGESVSLFDVALREGNLSTDAITFLYGERGVSKSLVGCTLTAAFVLGIKIERATDDDPYLEAHVDLIRGDNYYYLVRNAMCKARQGVLGGDQASKKLWVKRARRGLDQAETADPRNYQRAKEIFDERMAYLGDYQTAFDSVFIKP